MSNKRLTSIILTICFIGIVSVLFCTRIPQDSDQYDLSDCTYHVLLTIQALDETPFAIHKGLPIQTFADDDNKYIDNGWSLIQDD